MTKWLVKDRLLFDCGFHRKGSFFSLGGEVFFHRFTGHDTNPDVVSYNAGIIIDLVFWQFIIQMELD